jgi:hypothetical protein
MSPMQYASLCAENVQVASMPMNTANTHEAVPIGTDVRIQTALITTPILQQKRWIPLRWMPLVIELELNSSYTSMCKTDGGTPSWVISDVCALYDSLTLDPALDNAFQERIDSDRLPMQMDCWSTQKQILDPAKAAEFTLQMLRGVSRLNSIVITFEGPTDTSGITQKVNTLFFPKDCQESMEFYIQIGDQRQPEFPVRGIRQAFYMARLGNCDGNPVRSQHMFVTGLTGFGGSALTPGHSFWAAVDTEKICHTDGPGYSGLDVKGGVQLMAFFKGLLSSASDGVTAAYFHINYTQIVSASASGILVED